MWLPLPAPQPARCSSPARARRPAGALRALWVAMLAACGGSAPPLPSAPPAVDAPVPHADHVEPALRLLRDRGALRSGFACADCHRLGTDDHLVRGGPDLGPQRDTRTAASGAVPRAPAVARCLERYGATPGDEPERLGRLLAALRALRATPPPDPTADPATAAGPQRHPATLWRSACAHCHDTGPGPSLHRRPWPAARFTAAVRGTAGPPHPTRQMPAFSPAHLADADLAVLARALEAGDLAP